ncbi:MAG TPA: hypothetical protein ACFYD2_02755 [Candidatus Avalokitesvara rifleensis]|uniref:hypothetical protein n=1 Tax=Candidatus Avalokitesvara rifleensis TaxID=3367620 RepID=UPI00271294FF|nr:hypothetical protein [Candidatus Brocadiales bacterium]
MLIAVQILGAIGGLLVLIAGFVGSKPFITLKPPASALNAAQLTGVFRLLKTYMSWALLLFALGGIFIMAAFIVFMIM